MWVIDSLSIKWNGSFWTLLSPNFLSVLKLIVCIEKATFFILGLFKVSKKQKTLIFNVFYCFCRTANALFKNTFSSNEGKIYAAPKSSCTLKKSVLCCLGPHIFICHFFSKEMITKSISTRKINFNKMWFSLRLKTWVSQRVISFKMSQKKIMAKILTFFISIA